MSDSEPGNLDAARDEIRAAVPEAARTVRSLLDADDERVRLKAAEAVLDRAGLVKASARSDRSARKKVGQVDNGDDLDELLR
jgi:hypothetical protein